CGLRTPTPRRQQAAPQPRCAGPGTGRRRVPLEVRRHARPDREGLRAARPGGSGQDAEGLTSGDIDVREFERGLVLERLRDEREADQPSVLPGLEEPEDLIGLLLIARGV